MNGRQIIDFRWRWEKSDRNLENKMKINNEKYTISTECHQ